jgi:F-type H+-transporting ATPase subunit delta
VAGEESTVSGMAGRYATALFELALDAKTVDAVKADLDSFDRMIGESADLHRLVRSPVFGAEEQGRRHRAGRQFPQVCHQQPAVVRCA